MESDEILFATRISVTVAVSTDHGFRCWAPLMTAQLRKTSRRCRVRSLQVSSQHSLPPQAWETTVFCVPSLPLQPPRPLACMTKGFRESEGAPPASLVKTPRHHQTRAAACFGVVVSSSVCTLNSGPVFSPICSKHSLKKPAAGEQLGQSDSQKRAAHFEEHGEGRLRVPTQQISGKLIVRERASVTPRIEWSLTKSLHFFCRRRRTAQPASKRTTGSVSGWFHPWDIAKINGAEEAAQHFHSRLRGSSK